MSQQQDLGARSSQNPAVARFTPGPWHSIFDESWNQSEITAPSREGMVEIATVGLGYSGPVGVEQDANLHLILAATDLYAALIEACLQIEYLHAKFNPTGTGEAVLARSNMVLAKARGEA